LAATLLDRHEKKAETHATLTDANIIQGMYPSGKGRLAERLSV
jgi:hypothetical protein